MRVRVREERKESFKEGRELKGYQIEEDKAKATNEEKTASNESFENKLRR